MKATATAMMASSRVYSSPGPTKAKYRTPSLNVDALPLLSENGLDVDGYNPAIGVVKRLDVALEPHVVVFERIGRTGIPSRGSLNYITRVGKAKFSASETYT